MRIGRGMRLATFVAVLGAWVAAPDAGPRAAPYSLIDRLVWNADMEIDLTAYAPDARLQIAEHRRRFEAYQSKRPKPGRSPELAMVYAAQVHYERQLAAVSSAREAGQLALAYVTELRPCYEWEGYHDCPEREAMFAAAYQAAHPGGPFSGYLPLLEAHRWLCTAEAYDTEKAPAEAARARRSYDAALAVARQSASLLVRTGAAELSARNRCFWEGGRATP